ncbi:uncharacterized protein LOC132563068 [Ylistrum balloti]|uniref:uncharacterized protein LOC132563068 n=1 Tax=Ylistrum balloti TaxID=509963 RepID=UPI002905E9E5|nr:uncharacterized protein LOC132563068 [Ylistrum balloti]
MTKSSCGSMCPRANCQLSLLFLTSALVYVILYYPFVMKTNSIAKMNKGTINNIKNWWKQTEGWKQLNLSSRSERDVANTDGDLEKTEVLTSRRNFDLDRRVTKGSMLHFQSFKNISKHRGVENKSELLLTLFTSWHTKPEKYICYNNTIRNWSEFKPFIQTILFTNEVSQTKEALRKGWDVLPVKIAANGVPILKYMYIDAIERYDSPYYAYSNGDILYSYSLIDTLRAVMNSSLLPSDRLIMVTGRRTNVKNVMSDEVRTVRDIEKTAHRRGKLFAVHAEDYFITSASYPWVNIPEVIIGRTAYDNWLVLNARQQNHVTIDATNTLVALHQSTQAGDYEGKKANHSAYNSNLLRQMYKHIRYVAGFTSCAGYYTLYHGNHQIQLMKRKELPKWCYPVW